MLRRTYASLAFIALACLAFANASGVNPKTAARKLPEPIAKDLTLQDDGAHKADALSHFVEGIEFEESGEMEKALEAYRKVLNLDPGQIDLATRVAALLIHDDEYPDAIDVLKDAAKARPTASEPYQQLAFIYAKYLHKNDQAIAYANKAIALNPREIDNYGRLFEIAVAAGDEKRALETLDRAAKIQTDNPNFWIKLGRLYSAVYLKPDATPSPPELARLNEIYQKAIANGHDDENILREAGDYFAGTQQLKEALPLYLRVLELKPDDSGVREKLAAAFVVTNQRPRAIETLESIIKEHPEKYQPYEVLAQLYDDEGRSLSRASKIDEAAVEFKKAAEKYEQALLINPNRPAATLRLAELWLAPLKKSERAVTLLRDARRRYPDSPEFAYYLAVGLREAKNPKEAIISFEEARAEAEDANPQMLNARFYFDYGMAAEQASLYDKAADLYRKAIAIDPGNAADPYNALGYMWAEQNSHLDEAEDAVKRALQVDPSNGAYLDSIGWVQFRQGKFDQALESVKRALQNLPREDAVVLEHLGDIELKLNHLPQALAAWQKAQALDSSNKTLAAKIENHKTRVSKGEMPKP